MLIKIILSFSVFAPSFHAMAFPVRPWPSPDGSQPQPVNLQRQAAPLPLKGTQIQPAPLNLPPVQTPPALNNLTPGAPAVKQLLNSLYGPDKSSGDDLKNGMSSRYGSMKQVPTDGEVEPCITAPSRVLKAFEEAMDFRKTCAHANKGEGQRIAINDFSMNDHAPYMYIFDVKGKCIGKTGVSYGNGLGQVAPEPCSRDGTHLTPPGFHITAFHDSTAFPTRVSLSMVGLEGQGSLDRGILVHPAANPGTASSWGCAGVGAFDDVRDELGPTTKGEGALIYNYFGSKRSANGCGTSAGLPSRRGETCEPDSGAPKIPSHIPATESNTAN